MEQTHETAVEVQRSVRYNRLLIVGAVVGAAVGALVALMFPVPEGAKYTLAQIAGLSAVLGAALGLLLGGVLGLLLGLISKRHRGTGVAIQSDVR